MALGSTKNNWLFKKKSLERIINTYLIITKISISCIRIFFSHYQISRVTLTTCFGIAFKDICWIIPTLIEFGNIFQIPVRKLKNLPLHFWNLLTKFISIYLTEKLEWFLLELVQTFLFFFFASIIMVGWLSTM